ncbi:MAG: hypothetical protein JXR53_10415 [Bacteroidales bacterium]|nr:hypothetical protein [Bacteroidales bacterium]
MDGYPFEGIFFENIDTTFIISKKRDALRCKGEKVYLILGMEKDGSSKKAFYLWGYTLVEEIEVTESNEYALKGCLKLCQQPQLLNNREGFENLFKKTTGSFAFGLQNVSKDILSDQIKELCSDGKILQNANSDKNVYLKWLNEFESENNIDDKKALTEIDKNNNAIVSFFRESENSSIDMELRYRAIGWAITYPSLLVEYVINDSRYSNVHALVCDPIIELITKIPNKKYILYSFPDEILDNRFTALKGKYNVEFKIIGT